MFARLSTAAFQACFRDWVQEVAAPLGVEQIAIDGKTVRRSHDRGSNQAALHHISSWATAYHLILGQVAVSDQSNEIMATPSSSNCSTWRGSS